MHSQTMNILSPYQQMQQRQFQHAQYAQYVQYTQYAQDGLIQAQAQAQLAQPTYATAQPVPQYIQYAQHATTYPAVGAMKGNVNTTNQFAANSFHANQIQINQFHKVQNAQNSHHISNETVSSNYARPQPNNQQSATHCRSRHVRQIADLARIQSNLNAMHSAEDLLDSANQSILYGVRSGKVSANGLSEWHVDFNQLTFVFTPSMDTLLNVIPSMKKEASSRTVAQRQRAAFAVSSMPSAKVKAAEPVLYGEFDQDIDCIVDDIVADVEKDKNPGSNSDSSSQLSGNDITANSQYSPSMAPSDLTNPAYYAVSQNCQDLDVYSMTGSRRSSHGEGGAEEAATAKREYHTIYMKPIVERMRAILYSEHRDRNVYASVDSNFIIGVVDNAIQFGAKRQISKRTFEFKCDEYTVIMSKSLKTILDVTKSSDVEVITVHPDVVSIISKKCSHLDYFTIQKLAAQAKKHSTFTTKKNDYRQQFIYDFCECRIVFASNHATIVEMQCNEPNAHKMQQRIQQCVGAAYL